MPHIAVIIAAIALVKKPKAAVMLMILALVVRLAEHWNTLFGLYLFIAK